MKLNTLRFGFIGGGNMASAMISGLLQSGVAREAIVVVERNPQASAQLFKQFSLTTLSAPNLSLSQCDVVILAVKPQQFPEMIEQIKSFVTQALLISVAAGICLVDLQRWFDNHQRIVRAMPNTPALIGQGMTGLAASATINQRDRDIATFVAQAMGESIWVKNDAEIDAVTAISGSGPAYVFYFIEAMQEAAQALGLNAEQGKNLATATMIGAATLARNAEESPAQLRQRVTSPGGTTLAALNVLNDHKVNEIFKKAMLASATRSKEMGQLFSQNSLIRETK